MNSPVGWMRRHPDLAFSASMMALTIAPLLLAPVRARFLGPEGRGLLAAFQADLSASAVVGMLGVRLAAYAVDIGSHRRDDIRLSGIVAAGTVAYLVVASLLVIPTFDQYGSLVAVALAVGLLLVPGWIIGQTELARAQLSRDRPWILTNAGGPALIEFCGNLALAVGRWLTVLNSVVVTVLAEAFRSLTGVWRFLRERRRSHGGVRATRRGCDGTAHLLGRALTSKSIAFAPAAILPTLALSLDVILYSFWLPVEALGVYAVAKLGLTILYPLATALEGRHVHHVQRLGLLGGVLRSCMEAAPIAMSIGIAGAVLIPVVFGEAFASAAWPFAVGTIGGVLRFGFVSCAAWAASNAPSTVQNASVGVLVVAEAVLCIFVAVTVGPSVLAMVLAVIGSQLCGFLTLVCLSWRASRGQKVR
jgi:O-antigen/teichoic acid export membrane protein